MIVYDLQCPNGHVFEGWFEDGAAYAEQREQGLIACPVCNDSDVRRIPAPFAIKGAAPARRAEMRPEMEAAILARAVMEYMENNFDNVGTEFAKEALKMHYGVVEPRNIRGVSTAREEETLRQEGVSFFKVPSPASSDSTPDSSPDSDD
jgi:Uncharacterized protein conserved in bacteria